jgi:malonate decarboxylase gamma subunit
MGAIHELWRDGDAWKLSLGRVLTLAENGDGRAQLGLDRGGRLLAAPVAALVANA